MTRHYKTTLMWRTQNWDNSYISKCGPKRGARPTLAENLLTKTHQQEKQFNKMLQARIQHSGLLKYFQDSRTPMEKMKIWKSGNIFFGKNWKY